MSIYATLWQMVIPIPNRYIDTCDVWACVYAQAVPAHIGHPSQYPDGDPYSDFLPPVVKDYDPETDQAPYYRAVVILQHGRNKKEGQRYTDPLLVLSGEEYARIPFQNLLDLIREKIDWKKFVLGFFVQDEGRKNSPFDEEPFDDEMIPF